MELILFCKFNVCFERSSSLIKSKFILFFFFIVVNNKVYLINKNLCFISNFKKQKTVVFIRIIQNHLNYFKIEFNDLLIIGKFKLNLLPKSFA